MSILSTYIAARTRKRIGQFGQPASVATFGGKTACGPTSAQSIIYAFKRVLPSLDSLCRTMGYWKLVSRSGVPLGTTAEMNAKALGRWRLSYRALYNHSITQLRALTAKGPVMLVVWYPTYPNWKGYHSRTRATPWAKPYGRAGANQFPKPGIFHWVVWAGVMTTGPYKGLCAVYEPNHGSGARPEKVAIDYISIASLTAAYRAAGGRIAVVPTRTVA